MNINKNTPCELCQSRKFSLFEGLSEEHLCNLSGHKNLISHKKGQMLYYENTRPLGVFCINSGIVKVFKTASNGKEQIISLAQKGDFLGFASLLGEDNYSNSATIIEDALICFVPKETFLDIIAKDNNFHRRLISALCQTLGGMEEQLTDASHKTIRERLAFTLVKLCDSYGVEQGGGRIIDIILSREEIAGLVGTSAEPIIRLLSEFKKDNLIRLDGKKIIVLDEKGLIKLADFYKN